ncbi:uncharacterized protein PHACADRAFT_261014 [Phanerochaete carnosa HHB-10118-sp]|uniref:Uncharacterized protein n=1 Tax=Phanerochaete carnosa (strain HHB-10118-sp) TaxID=650164 RepID=K5W0X2_PHACS|nr:uncharacterized protein PHACADRAFT_261014 [Phanerochaete carnosa HHB-10118-sp]EKM52529.1 hypothetical protein PHACADRAFT_261014 [Phanerochaete carnosa HHB-10118-sp]
MRPELPILSFLCLVLLMALTLLHVNSRNVAVLALIGWLLVCSLVQGVDSVAWAQNTVVRTPVWCDIATKVLLGSRLAIPAACSSISYHLYFLSSNRDAKRRPHRTLFEVTFCIVSPIFYMAFHIIVQNHRFDLTQDFGCVASIYTSSAAIILVWIPPFLFCTSSLVFAGLSLLAHIRRSRQLSDRVCLSSRLITVTFLRPLFTAIIISLLVLTVSIFDFAVALTSDGGLQPWLSWSSVHTNLSQVQVIPQMAYAHLHRIEAWWWVAPTATLVFSSTALVGLVYCAQTASGNGYRNPARWFHTSLFHRSRGDEFIQCSEGFSTRLTSQLTIPSLSPLSPTEAISGWDDTVRSEKVKPKLPPITCSLPPVLASPSNPGPESSKSAQHPSLAYMQSPSSPEPPMAATPAQPHWSTLLKSPPPSLASVPSSSPADSILSSPWPRPPSTVPVTPVLSPTSPQSPTVPAPSYRYARPPSMSSLSTSAASSTISANAYLGDPDALLHGVPLALRRAPFADAGIPAPTLAMPLVERNRSPLRRIPSLEGFHARKMSLTRGSGAGNRRDVHTEGIYMTVVQETV